MTREQIIDLINQYIYTNGNQRITAAQLNEILLEIANAFAMEGVGGGIDSVLEAGNTVTAGRTIINEDGGSVLLAAHGATESYEFAYIGLDVSVPNRQTFNYLLKNQASIGNLTRVNPSRNIFNIGTAPLLLKGEILAATNYTSINSSDENKAGIVSVVLDDSSKTSHEINQKSVTTAITDGIDNAQGAFQRIQETEIRNSLIQGPQSASHVQHFQEIIQSVENQLGNFDSILSYNNHLWRDETGNIAWINGAGIDLETGKTLALNSSGSKMLLKADGPNASIKVSGSTTTSLGLDANYIGFRDGANVYGSFGYDACQLTTVFNVNRAGNNSTPTITSTHTGTANNVAVYANAINGTNNIAFLADNGNLVVKNGYAMIGFGSDITPNARVDIKTLGPTFGDLGLRIRNSADTYSILEVRGDGEVQCSTTTNSSASIRANNSGGGDNIGIQVNSYNGTTNTALLAVSGNVVTQTGSAMFGFGPGNVIPEARVDVKAQGATSTDLALRVRNSAGTSNIMEVRGDGDILVGTGLLTAGTGIGSNLIHGFSIDGCRVDSDMEYQGTDQYNYGRIHLRGTDFDTEGTNVINIANGTAPATDNADAFRFYSADQVAGNAAPHFRTENGAVIKIYQETTAVGDATLAGGAGTPLTDTDTFDGYTLKQIVKALRNLGLLD